ncbi:MAG: hypothetical protein K2W96_15685, partial [Gemmataceae bacterium]|nr:hypothetical protein [Gemmataceae bacterium]
MPALPSRDDGTDWLRLTGSRPQPSPSCTAPRPGPPPGSRAGRYLLLEEIARGGMGAVWRARDDEMGRDLAVKVMLPGRDDAESVRRFRQEARITGQLEHPGIVPVHEMG